MDETRHSVKNYTVVRKLGEGGMGVVYLATDLRLGRPVALKMLRHELAANATDRDRFLREARVAAAVEQDNIVPIWDIDEAADGSPFIVMPFLRGESLDARLRRDPVPPLAFVLKVAGDVAAGLAAAHAAGLVHRDIKPANIWLEGDPTAADLDEQVRRCKILDFGLARSASPGDAQITGSGVILGTPAYMAPEQARGSRVDHRADLFSLGVVLYRMATGLPPFKGDTPLSFLVAVATETAPAVRVANPRLHPGLAELIDKLLNKDPDARPRSAAEVASTVRKISAAPPPIAPSNSFPQILSAAEQSDSDTVPVPPVRHAPGSRWRLIAVAACLLALVPFGAWLAGAFNGKKAEEAAIKPDTPQPPVEQPKQPTVVEPQGAEKKVASDPDRTAALWVVRLGGCVRINGEDDSIVSAAGLPTEPFKLTAITLTENPKVTDDLTALAGCRHLMTLGLSGTAVGDTGLAHLKDCPLLMYVYLTGTRVTSAGLAALRDHNEIVELDLSYTRVDDGAVKHLARFTKLTHLFLTETKMTPAGVADLTRALPGCEVTSSNGVVRPPDLDRRAALWVLSASGSVHVNGKEIKKVAALPKEPFELTGVSLTVPVKDADLAALAGCKNLTTAYLGGSGITNEGLAHLKDCTNLTELFLSGTQVGDESSAVLRRFTKLVDLSVGRSAFTDKGAKALAKALPKCRIQYDGGTIEPTEK